jgi:hypothetical protein
VISKKGVVGGENRSNNDVGRKGQGKKKWHMQWAEDSLEVVAMAVAASMGERVASTARARLGMAIVVARIPARFAMLTFGAGLPIIFIPIPASTARGTLASVL